MITAAVALAAGAVGAFGCTSSGTVATTSYAYDDAWVYTSYYPADVAYASYYYAYPWNYTTFYYYLGAYGPGTTGAAGTNGTNGAAGTTGTAGTTGSGGASGTGGTSVALHSGVASAIEALARGQQVCPGQVTVTEKKAAGVCQSNAADVRVGATITFNNCVAPGGTINGMIDVQGTATASDQTCGAATTITVNHTSTFTNLSIKVADGRTLILPNQTNTGMTTFTFGQSPTKTDITSNGELKILDSAGAPQADLAFMENNSFTFSGSQSYSVDGTTTVQDKNSSATATITRQGLVRSGGCCRPTGGSMTVNRTNGQFPGQATWTFGPSCGQIDRDGVSAAMPTCM
jgi:hypothetical protein